MPQEHGRLSGNAALVSRIDDVEGLSDHAKLLFMSKGIRYVAQLAAFSRTELLRCTENNSAVNQAGNVLRAAGLEYGDTQPSRRTIGYLAPANRHGVLFPATTDEGMKAQPAGDPVIRARIESLFNLKPGEPVLAAHNHDWFTLVQKKSLTVRFRDAALDDPEFRAAHAETQGKDQERIRGALNRVIARRLDLG